MFQSSTHGKFHVISTFIVPCYIYFCSKQLRCGFFLQDRKQHKEPTSLIEQFFIVGLHSDANLEAIEDAFAQRKIWELEMAKSEIQDLRKLQYRGPPLPTLEPQVDHIA